MTARDSFVALVFVCAAICSAGCGSETPSPLDTASLVELQEPELDRLDPLVREQLQASRTRVRELRGDADVDRNQLGAAYAELGRLYHTYQFFDPAIPCYLNAETLLGDDYRWSYYLGRAYASVDRPADARGAFERTLVLKPDDGPARVALGRAHLAEAELDAAERVARDVLESDPDSASAILLLAETAAERGDAAAAVDWYEMLLNQQPGATKMYKALAMAYRGSGRLEDARRALSLSGEGLVKLKDPLMGVLRPLAAGAQQFRQAGVTAFQRGDFEQAVILFRRAIEADPDYEGDRLNLGSALAQLGRNEEAAEQMREVIELNPQHVLAHYNLGVVLDSLGRREEAIEVYRAALRIDDAAFQPRFNLATALREEGQCDEALVHFTRIIRDFPGNRAARVGEALCLVQQSRFDEATARLDGALRVSPESQWLTRITARLFAASPQSEMRDGPRALEFSRILVDGEPSPLNLETLAMALAEVGQFAEAISTQQSAIDAAERRQRSDLLERLRLNMARYREGKPARDPALS